MSTIYDTEYGNVQLPASPESSVEAYSGIMTDAELTTFLFKSITPKNFSLFAALANLSEPTMYKRVLDLLFKNHITLDDIEALPLIDDKGIAEMLKSIDRFKRPYLNATPSDGSTKAYDYLMTDTPLSSYITMLNAEITESRELPEPTANFNAFYVTLAGSLYADSDDLENHFKEEIITPILLDYKSEDIRVMLPEFTVPDDSSTGIDKLIRRMYDEFYAPFDQSFNNVELSSIFIWTDDRPSVTVSAIAKLTHIYELKKENTVASQQLHADVYNMASLNKTVFTRAELDELWEELFNVNLTASSISDVFSYIFYKIAYLNTLEQKNNGTTNSNAEERVKEFYDVLVAYRNVHQTLDGIIFSNMHVKTF